MKQLAVIALLFYSIQTSAWEPVKSTVDLKYPALNLDIRFIVKDHRGMVWIGADQGLMYTDGSQVGPLHRSPSTITAMSVVDTVIWVGTVDGHIRIFDPVSRRWTHTFAATDSSEITAVRRCQGSILIGTVDRGLIRITNRDTTTITAIDGLRDNTVHDVIRFGKGIFIGTDRGLAYWRPDEGPPEAVGPPRVITALAAVDSTLWLGTVKNGPLGVDMPSRQPTSLSHRPDRAHILKFHVHHRGVLAATAQGVTLFPYDSTTSAAPIYVHSAPTADFIITDDGMVLILSPQGRLTTVDLRFAGYSAPWVVGSVTAVAVSDSRLYIADSIGVTTVPKENPSDITRTELPTHPVVVTMLPTHDGLYVGTFNEGIFKLNHEGEITETITESQGLPDNNVLSMAVYDDTLRIATLSGLSAFTTTSGVIRPKGTSPFGNTYIYAIHAGEDGLFIGTDGRGAFSYRKGRYDKLHLPANNASGTVYQFAEDRNGNIWMNFKDNSLLVYQSRDKVIRTVNDFPKDEGYYMLAGSDSTSALAIGDQWLCIIDQAGVKLSDRRQKFPALSGEYLGNVARDSQGHVYFATGNQLYRYVPDHGVQQSPRLVISGLRVNLTESSVDRNRFHSDENHLTVSWAVLWYQNPENVAVRYRLRGQEDAWSYTQNRELIYPSLSPGSYELEIQAGVEGIFYPVGEIIRSFSVSKPLYLRTWFLTSVGVFFILLTYIGMRAREARLNRLKTEKLRAVETELTVLRNQVNPHFLFNGFNTLMNIIETDPHKASEYLQRLSDYYRKILTKRQYAAMSLREELENLKEYFYLQKYRFGEALRLDTSIDEASLDSQLPAMTLQLLAENAVKHNVISTRWPLELQVFTTGSRLVVKNPRRPKKRPAEGAGMGLENIRSRYRVMYDRDIQIEILQDTFTVKLPLIHG